MRYIAIVIFWVCAIASCVTAFPISAVISAPKALVTPVTVLDIRRFTKRQVAATTTPEADIGTAKEQPFLAVLIVAVLEAVVLVTLAVIHLARFVPARREESRCADATWEALEGERFEQYREISKRIRATRSAATSQTNSPCRSSPAVPERATTPVVTLTPPKPARIRFAPCHASPSLSPTLLPSHNEQGLTRSINFSHHPQPLGSYSNPEEQYYGGVQAMQAFRRDHKAARAAALGTSLTAPKPILIHPSSALPDLDVDAKPTVTAKTSTIKPEPETTLASSSPSSPTKNGMPVAVVKGTPFDRMLAEMQEREEKNFKRIVGRHITTPVPLSPEMVEAIVADASVKASLGDTAVGIEPRDLATINAGEERESVVAKSVSVDAFLHLPTQQPRADMPLATNSANEAGYIGAHDVSEPVKQTEPGTVVADADDAVSTPTKNTTREGNVLADKAGVSPDTPSSATFSSPGTPSSATFSTSGSSVHESLPPLTPTSPSPFRVYRGAVGSASPSPYKVPHEWDGPFAKPMVFTPKVAHSSAVLTSEAGGRSKSPSIGLLDLVVPVDTMSVALDSKLKLNSVKTASRKFAKGIPALGFVKQRDCPLAFYDEGCPDSLTCKYQH